jgi:hypothetical protein
MANGGFVKHTKWPCAYKEAIKQEEKLSSFKVIILNLVCNSNCESSRCCRGLILCRRHNASRVNCKMLCRPDTVDKAVVFQLQPQMAWHKTHSSDFTGRAQISAMNPYTWRTLLLFILAVVWLVSTLSKIVLLLSRATGKCPSRRRGVPLLDHSRCLPAA